MYKVWFMIYGNVARLDKEYKTKAGATKAGYRIFGKEPERFIVAVECPYEK